MPDRIIPDNGQSAGIPGSYTEAWPDSSNALITGHEPAILTDDVQFPADIDWPALSPITITAGVAALAAAGTAAHAITVKPMKFAAGDTGHFGPVYKAGCFNPDLIAWPASYDTFAKKRVAFNGAPTPTNIVIRKVAQYSEKTTDYFAA